MWWDHLGSIVAVLTFLLTFIGQLIWWTTRLARFDVSLREMIAKLQRELEGRVTQTHKEIDDRIEQTRLEFIERTNVQAREFGETVSAVRLKVQEVELFSRDTFLRRVSFYKAQENMEASLSKFAEKIETRLERMEEKIDTKT